MHFDRLTHAHCPTLHLSLGRLAQRKRVDLSGGPKYREHGLQEVYPVTPIMYILLRLSKYCKGRVVGHTLGLD